MYVVEEFPGFFSITGRREHELRTGKRRIQFPEILAMPLLNR
jgi:hypothetical protein